MLIDAAQFKGEIGGLIALAFGSGCLASFGYSWAFFVLPSKKALERALEACEKERNGGEAKLAVLEAKHEKELALERHECAEKIARLDVRVRELENFFTVHSIGNIRQMGQMRSSAHHVVEQIAELNEQKKRSKKEERDNDDGA